MIPSCSGENGVATTSAIVSTGCPVASASRRPDVPAWRTCSAVAPEASRQTPRHTAGSVPSGTTVRTAASSSAGCMPYRSASRDGRIQGHLGDRTGVAPAGLGRGGSQRAVRVPRPWSVHSGIRGAGVDLDGASPVARRARRRRPGRLRPPWRGSTTGASTVSSSSAGVAARSPSRMATSTRAAFGTRTASASWCTASHGCDRGDHRDVAVRAPDGRLTTAPSSGWPALAWPSDAASVAARRARSQ